MSYCSGIPYATHYVGQALPEPAEKGGGPGPPLLFVAPRSAFRVLDDWGELLGLVGSGSNSIVFDKAVVPAHWVIENTHMADVDPSGERSARDSTATRCTRRAESASLR